MLPDDQNSQHDEDLPSDQVEAPSPVSDATQTPSAKRLRLQRERRIERILTASQRLFSTQAYDEIAIEDLAAAAGMSKGLLYHYFASKRDLYVATVAHVLTQMAHFTDLSPDLHAGLSQMLSLFEQSPGLAKLVLRGGIGVDPEVESLLNAYRQQQLERLYQGLGFLGEFTDASTDTSGEAQRSSCWASWVTSLMCRQTRWFAGARRAGAAWLVGLTRRGVSALGSAARRDPRAGGALPRTELASYRRGDDLTTGIRRRAGAMTLGGKRR